jgi:acetyl-CoA acetyltransferase
MTAHILGVGMTRFARQPQRTVEELAHEAILAAVDDAGIELRDIQVAFVGSALLGDGIGQKILKDLGVCGLPINNVVNACASGTNAMHEATMWIRAGACDLALAVGVESLSRSLHGSLVPLPEEDLAGGHGLSLPALYAIKAQRYMAEYGATARDFAAVSSQARANGSLNPYAMFQLPLTIEEVLNSGFVAEPITKFMCCANADGASAVIVGSSSAARKVARKTVEIAGSAMVSGLLRDRVEQWSDHGAERAAKAAFAAAGIGPEDVAVAEVQDPFSVATVMYAEDLGLAPRGEGAKRFAAGEYQNGKGRTAVNATGGILARGHPLAATGLAQVHDLVRQLRGEAGPCQVHDPKVALQFNNGGTVMDVEATAFFVNVLKR